MKKTVSVCLSLVMLLSIFSFGFTALAAGGKCTCSHTPTLYIKGRTNIYKDVSKYSVNQNGWLETDIPDEELAEKNLSGGSDAIKEAALNITEDLLLGLLTDNWSPYCDVVYEELSPLYDQYPLNEDGEIGNNSGISPMWNVDAMITRYRNSGRNYHTYAGVYDNMEAYQYQYDCRLDPCENAEGLKRVIDTLTEVSGHDKINIVARCEGTVIANAYFNMFGYDKVDQVIIYNSIACGVDVAEQLFVGKATFNATAMNRFINEYLGSDPLYDFIKATSNLLTFAGFMGDALDFVTKIYKNVAPELMPRMLRATFSTCPGWYSMISADKCRDCLNYALDENGDGKYEPKYQKLVDKVLNYNDNYKINARSILEEMSENGVHVYLIAKYNEQMMPVVSTYNVLSDDTVSVYSQTYEGATCANTGKVLSSSYIEAAKENGTDRFISPDNKLDASTGLLPEHTWYIRDLQHDYYPKYFEEYMLKILWYDGYTTVDSLEDVPQWLLFVGEKDGDSCIKPLTKDNAQETELPEEKNILGVLFLFFSKLFYFLQSLFAKND